MLLSVWRCSCYYTITQSEGAGGSCSSACVYLLKTLGAVANLSMLEWISPFHGLVGNELESRMDHATPPTLKDIVATPSCSRMPAGPTVVAGFFV